MLLLLLPFGCSLLLAATVDHPISIFDVDTGFMPRIIPDVSLPFYLGLVPAQGVKLSAARLVHCLGIELAEHDTLSY